MAKQELLASIRDRCRESSRKDKSKILDEFIAVTCHHRKHGIRLLAQSAEGSGGIGALKGRRIYDDSVREVVILIWEASDRVCGKRLKVAMPHPLDDQPARPSAQAISPELVEGLASPPWCAPSTSSSPLKRYTPRPTG